MTQKEKVINILFYLFCLFFSLEGFSQEIFLKNYTVEDGLPSNETFDVVQDNKGYIWIASELGVIKYDGYDFTTYNFDTTEIDNAILKLYKDTAGRIWFISLNGLLAYYENDSIKLYENNDQIKPFVKKNGLLSCFYADEDKNIDFGVRGLGLLKLNKDSVRLLDTKGKTSIEYPSRVYVQTNKNHINFFNYGPDFDDIRRFPYASFNLNEKKRVFFPGHIDHSSFFSYVQLSKSKWLCAFYKWLFILENDAINIVKQFPKEIICIKKDNSKSYWIGLNDGGGVYEFNFESKKTNHYLVDNSVTGICFDHQNGMWCSTLERGVFYSQNKTIRFVLNDNTEEDILTDFTSKQDTLLVLASDGKIFKLTNDTCFVSISPKMKDKEFWIEKINNKYFFGPHRRKKVYELTGNRYEVVKASDPVTQKPGVIALETKDSLFMPNVGTSTVGCTKENFASLFFMLNRNRMDCSYQTNQCLYFGNNSGLWYYNYDYSENISEERKIKGRVKSISINKHDDIVTGMKESGIFVITEDSTYQLTKKNGLTSNYIQYVTTEEDTIWSASEDGIDKIIILRNKGPLRFKIFNLNRKDGLFSGNVKKILPQKTAIWGLTPTGVLNIKRSNFTYSKDTLLLILDSVFVNDSLVSLSEGVVLNYWENNLKVHFTALDFHPNSELVYHYKLTPGDNKIHKTNNQSVNFSNLQSGNYSFTLYASNGKTQSKTYSISFQILSPWWQTWWFYALELIVIASILMVVFKIRSRVLIKKAVQKETIEKEKIELKLKALRAQMNPHFMFNSLNSILYYILENDINLAAKYLSKFSKLVRSILQNSEEGNVTLENEIFTLNLYLELEQLRLENKFDYSITSTIGEKIRTIKIPTLLIQPVIENAVWHGISKKHGKGKIDVLFELEDNIIVATVTDNGVGRSATIKKVKENTEFQKKSMGINITKERLNMLQNNISGELQFEVIDLFEDDVPAGTKVIIRVPVQQT